MTSQQYHTAERLPRLPLKPTAWAICVLTVLTLDPILYLESKQLVQERDLVAEELE